MKKPKKYDQITGEWVREQRIKAGMSQQEVANLIGACDRQHICKIEKTGAMSAQTKYKLFDLFCVVK